LFRKQLLIISHVRRREVGRRDIGKIVNKNRMETLLRKCTLLVAEHQENMKIWNKIIIKENYYKMKNWRADHLSVMEREWNEIVWFSCMYRYIIY
jgi:hypothetical protein